MKKFIFPCLLTIHLLTLILPAQSFRKVSHGDVVNDSSDSRAANWVDFNNDGYLDLFITTMNHQRNFLYMNDSYGNLELVPGGEILNEILHSQEQPLGSIMIMTGCLIYL